MNIKKRLVTYACLSLALASGVQAQQEEKYDYRRTPFYIMPQVTVNYTDNENSHFQDWEKMLAPGAAITFGKEFSPLWGWRTSLGYKRNRETSNWRDMERNYNFITFDNVEAFCDLTFDYSDLVYRSNKRRHWKVLLFCGVGGAKAFGFGDEPLSTIHSYTNKPSAVLGLRGGFNASYLLSDKVALSLEGLGYMFQDRFNGVDDRRVFDAKSGLALGVVFYVGKRKSITPEVVVPPEIIQPVEEKKVFVLTPILAYSTPAVEAKERMTKGNKAFVDFPVNKTEIYPQYRNNTKELSSIKASVDVVKNNGDFIIQSMELHGFASPEGGYANNDRLAKGRVEALRDWLMKEYGFNKELFAIQSTPEDWDGLRAYIVNCDLKDKQAILDLIDNNTLQPDEKERKLKTLNGGASYKSLLANVFPGLRHTDYVINYMVREFNVEEAKQRIFEHPELLSANEMFQVANAYGKGTEEYKKVCLIAAKTYPNNSDVNLNAANILLEEKNIEEAKAYLNKVKACPQKTHALAIIEALNGNYDTAREMLKESAAAGITESTELLKQLAE